MKTRLGILLAKCWAVLQGLFILKVKESVLERDFEKWIMAYLEKLTTEKRREFLRDITPVPQQAVCKMSALSMGYWQLLFVRQTSIKYMVISDVERTAENLLGKIRKHFADELVAIKE